MELDTELEEGLDELVVVALALQLFSSPWGLVGQLNFRLFVGLIGGLTNGG